MRVRRNELARVWTGAMLLIAAGLAIYFTAYVWRRVERPQIRDGGQRVSNSTEDWAYYYAAANAMRTGVGDIYTVKAPERDRAGYIYPPMLAFLYQPLAKMGFFAGARVSVVVDVLAMAGALGFAARALLLRVGNAGAWRAVLTAAVLGALLSSDKLKGEFQMLQCNGLVAAGDGAGVVAVGSEAGVGGDGLGVGD